jgi:ribosomal protein L37AE/L43A
MTTETIKQTPFQTVKVTNHLNRHRIWMRCPRCIGGNMHREDAGEYVCMQCGRSYYPDKETHTTLADGIL